MWQFPDNPINLIFTGILIGIIVSAPMGPVGVLCVQRTLNKGRWYGFVTGVGAACSDMLYALITGVGMSFVSEMINNERNLFMLQLGGSALLMLFGIYTFRTKPQHRNIKAASHKKGSLWYNFWTGFLLTLGNPLIIFLFVALFARFAFVVPDSLISMSLGYSAICGGALLWWFVLTRGIDKLQSQFEERGLIILNRTIGAIVIVAAIIGFVFTIYGLSIVPH